MRIIVDLLSNATFTQDVFKSSQASGSELESGFALGNPGKPWNLKIKNQPLENRGI